MLKTCLLPTHDMQDTFFTVQRQSILECSRYKNPWNQTPCLPPCSHIMPKWWWIEWVCNMLNRIKGGKLGDLMLSKLAWLKLKDGIPQGKRMGPSRFVDVFNDAATEWWCSYDMKIMSTTLLWSRQDHLMSCSDTKSWQIQWLGYSTICIWNWILLNVYSYESVLSGQGTHWPSGSFFWQNTWCLT